MALQLMSYKVFISGVSDIGLVRRNNEDAWKMQQEEQFYILADGMGGHQAGEVASHESIEILSALFKDKFDPTRKLPETEQLLFELIQEVNTSIYRLASENVKFKGMGTTLCCLHLHPEGLIYAHVGDSRIYRLRKDNFEQLTTDHSLLRELIELGQLNEQQAGSFLYKNIITRAIGTEPGVYPTVKHDTIEVGDIFLMCTDGLSDMLPLAEIESIISQSPLEQTIPNLIDQAKKKGGYDNITAILVKVLDKYAAHLS